MKFLDKFGGIVHNIVQLSLPFKKVVKSYLGLQFSDLQIQFIQMLVHKGDESLKYENNGVKAYSRGQQFNTCNMNSTQKRICVSEETATQFLSFKTVMWYLKKKNLFLGMKNRNKMNEMYRNKNTLLKHNNS